MSPVYTVGHSVNYDTALSNGPVIRSGSESGAMGTIAFFSIYSALVYLKKKHLHRSFSIYLLDCDRTNTIYLEKDDSYRITKDTLLLRKVL